MRLRRAVASGAESAGAGIGALLARDFTVVAGEAPRDAGVLIAWVRGETVSSTGGVRSGRVGAATVLSPLRD
jgi:hypothetical protein